MNLYSCFFQTFYRLKIGTYHGDIDDAMTYGNNMPFTTKDVDNDNHGSNCAQIYQGAWWYHSCYHCNLNGLNYGYAKRDGTGMRWNVVGGDNGSGKDSLKSITMAIRPQ